MRNGPAPKYPVCVLIPEATEQRRRELLELHKCGMPVLLDRALIALEKHPDAGSEAAKAAT
jgi:hypothetical protein